jgi:methionyl-tRNA formyltransferase
MKILFAGSGAFGVPSLRRLLERGAEVVHVYTQPSKPAGRGHKLTPTPIGAFAAQRGLPFTELADINAVTLPPADLLVVIAFGQKLSASVVDHARLGAINLHASRLPKYRGAAPINWAIISGEKTAGNSIIRLAQTMDAGAVLAMSELPIGELETAGELHDRLSVDGAELVEQVASQLREGTARPIEQEHTLATKAPKLSREKSAIDFSRDAESIAHQIRGMHPWPGCRVRITDSSGKELDKLTLVRARRAWMHERAPVGSSPGEILSDGSIACGDGTLDIVEIHPDSRQPIPTGAYRNAERTRANWQPGNRLESVR